MLKKIKIKKQENQGRGLGLSKVIFPFQRGVGWGVWVQVWVFQQDSWVMQTLLCTWLFLRQLHIFSFFLSLFLPSFLPSPLYSFLPTSLLLSFFPSLFLSLPFPSLPSFFPSFLICLIYDTFLKRKTLTFPFQMKEYIQKA